MVRQILTKIRGFPSISTVHIKAKQWAKENLGQANFDKSQGFPSILGIEKYHIERKGVSRLKLDPGNYSSDR